MRVDLNEIVSVRKETPGADSYGHTWDRPGDIERMPRWQAYELAAIVGGGFALVEQRNAGDETDPVIQLAPVTSEPGPVTEPAPVVEPSPSVVDPSPPSLERDATADAAPDAMHSIHEAPRHRATHKGIDRDKYTETEVTDVTDPASAAEGKDRAADGSRNGGRVDGNGRVGRAAGRTEDVDQADEKTDKKDSGRPAGKTRANRR